LPGLAALAGAKRGRCLSGRSRSLGNSGAGDDRGSSTPLGASRAIDGASRTGLVSNPSIPSPSDVMSLRERAKPALPRLAGRRRNMPSRSTIPASLKPLNRDDFKSNRRRALAHCLRMIFSENRYPLFRIMRPGPAIRHWRIDSLAQHEAREVPCPAGHP